MIIIVSMTVQKEYFSDSGHAIKTVSVWCLNLTGRQALAQTLEIR